MKTMEPRGRLCQKIWDRAESARGDISARDFSPYVLSIVFYRFLSEQFIDYINKKIEAGGEGSYVDMSDGDEQITAELIKNAVSHVGYFIYPSQLSSRVVNGAENNENLSIDLRKIFDAIETSTLGHDSEQSFKGIFADFDTIAPRLGDSIKAKNKRLRIILQGVSEFDLNKFTDPKLNLFGDIFEFLLSKYAEIPGKFGDSFHYTPQSVSELLMRLACLDKPWINRIYDPACGLGSLLLQGKKLYEDDFVTDAFYGRESHPTAFNLARMNMLVHGFPYRKFHITLGEANRELESDAIVSNPPRSMKWVETKESSLITDERAPKEHGDLAFIMHAVCCLSPMGRAAIVCSPKMLFRPGIEQEVRQYLVDNNFVESVITLPPKLFSGTKDSLSILVLSKGKSDSKIRFVHGRKFFAKDGNRNTLKSDHIRRNINSFKTSEDIKHRTRIVGCEEVKQKKYNLSVDSYLKLEDPWKVNDVDIVNPEFELVARGIRFLKKKIVKLFKKSDK